MKFYTRRAIKPTDLNPSNVLFGGALLSWIDEEAAIFACCQMKTQTIVTKYMSEINFTSSAKSGDVIEFGMEVVEVGRTSMTLACLVRNKMTHESIINVDRIVFVAIGEDGRPVAHGAESNEMAVAI
jgi:acyl-CoA thioesterase YciA